MDINRILFCLKDAADYFEAGGIYAVPKEIYIEETQQLKAENEKLKAKNEKLKEKCRYWENNSYFHVYVKARKCLEEIKEIATKQYRSLITERDCISCDDRIKSILDKISEVIE